MEITLELTDPVVMQLKHTMFHIFHKFLATGIPVSKTLISIKAITWMKTMKKRRNQFILSLLNKKSDPYNDENAINFKWSNVQEEKDEVDNA